MSVKTAFFLYLFTCSTVLIAQDCPNPPTIEFLMVDACGPPEAPNEFAIINSADGFAVDDFQFTFNPTNTGFGSNNSNVNIDLFDPPCNVATGNADLYVGCDNVIALGPGDDVPPNSYVIFQTSNDADAIYDISNLCMEDECIYVIANSCNRTLGAFTNKQTASPGPRQNFVSIAGTSCFHEATYNTEDLISNANGNYFIPPDTYGITPGNPCEVPALPTLEQPLPSFDFSTEICSSEAQVFELPNLSEEAVAGTWSPDFDPNTSQTYIFTPNDGECYDELSLEINIIEAVIPEFSFSTTLCEDETFELPSISDNGIEGEWNPPVAEESIDFYEFTPAEDQCAENINIEFEFLPIEIPEFDLENTICEGENIDFPSVSANGIPGEWSPELDNQNSGTYTFTPDNECFPEFSIDIEVQEIIVLDFDINEEICENDAIDFLLPANSNNGFSGSWSPDFDPLNSATYTFQPDDLDCFEEFAISIEIIPVSIPVFDLPNEVCEGDFIELPDISDNGIEGVWNNEFDNENSATYTFIPNDVECANEISINIEVIENEIPIFDLPEEVCENEDFQLPEQSDNGISGSWTPIFGQATDNTYTFTPDDEFCALPTTIIIEIIPDVVPEFDLPELICEGDEVTLPSFSNNGIAGEWSPAFNPTQTETYTFTPTSEACLIDPIELTIEVFNFELNLNDLDNTQCSDDEIALSADFDLTSIANQIDFQGLGYLISFHLTEDDALTNQSPLGNTINISENLLTLFVRIEDEATDCITVEPVQFEVEVLPGPFPDSLSLEDCVISQDNLAQFFDLTTIENELSEGLNQLDTFEIDYYTSEIGAIEEDANQLIGNPTNYLSQTSAENLVDQVFIRITNSASSLRCFDVIPLLLFVDGAPEVDFTTLLSTCREDFNESELTTFDLTSVFLEDVENTSIEFDFFLSQQDLESGNAIENPSNFQNTVNPQSIFLQVSSQGSPCTIETNITLVVAPNPTFPEPEPVVACESVEAGISSFDLLEIADEIMDNQTDVEIAFYETEVDAQQNSNPILIQDENGESILYQNDNPFFQTLYIRLSAVDGANQLETNCFSIQALDLIIESIPEINALNDLDLCDDSTPNGSTAFDLTVNEPLILGNQNPEDFKVSYYLSIEDAQLDNNKIAVPQNYTNTLNPQEIFVRVESLSSDCFVANESFFIQVNQRPTIALTTAFEYVCADVSSNQSENNQQATFDLTTKDEEINLNFQDQNTEVRYYSTPINFENGIFIEDPSNFQNFENPQLIIAEVINSDTQCSSFSTVEFELHVHPIPLVDISNMDGSSICVDPISGDLIDPLNLPVLDTGLDASSYDFKWFLDGEVLPSETSPSLTTFIEGVYEVEVTDISYSLRTECFASSQAEILESSAPIFEIRSLTKPFSGNQQIEVFNINGIGNYEFSVDGGEWVQLNNQNSLIFEDLDFGDIQVVGRDINGCGEFLQQLTLIDYPKFFTPNNDGFNDTWNITSLNDQNALIYIFDRYGKLLKQLDSSSEGWDGSYNGKPMPSNDYWFKVEYEDPQTGAQKTFKSNFTLKR